MDQIALIDQRVLRRTRGAGGIGRRIVNFRSTKGPMVIDTPKSGEGILVVVGGAVVIINVAGAHSETEIAKRHNAEVGVEFRKALGDEWQLRTEIQTEPTHRGKSQPIIEIGNRAVHVGIDTVYIGKSIEEKPVAGCTIPAGLKAISHTEPPDGPAVNRIHGCELRQIKGLELCAAWLIARFGWSRRIIGQKSIKLEDLVHIGSSCIDT